VPRTSLQQNLFLKVIFQAKLKSSADFSSGREQNPNRQTKPATSGDLRLAWTRCSGRELGKKHKKNLPAAPEGLYKNLD
jgi:hypothetical protein